MKIVKLYTERESEREYVEVTEDYIDVCRKIADYCDKTNYDYSTEEYKQLYKVWDDMTTELAIANFGYFDASTSGYDIQFAVWDYFTEGDCCLVD